MSPAANERGTPRTDLPKRVRDQLERMGRALDAIDALLRRLALQGLQRMSSSSSAELLALSQTAHNAGLVRIERQLEALATHVRRYTQRDPLFSMGDYAGAINQVWLLSRAVRRRREEGTLPAEMLDLVGEARRTYTVVDEPMHLQPLGAWGWHTDSGFIGITVAMWCEGRDDLLQVTNARPAMHFGTDPAALLRMHISETVGRSMRDLAHGAWLFEGAKLSRDGRLSIHRDLRVSEGAYKGGRAYAACDVEDWRQLLDRLRDQERAPVRAPTEAPLLAYVRPAFTDLLDVDHKRARAGCTLADARRMPLRLSVPLRGENNLLVDNLERLYGTGVRVGAEPEGLFGRVSVSGGALVFHPYTAVFPDGITLRKGGLRRVHEVHLSLESLEKARG